MLVIGVSKSHFKGWLLDFILLIFFFSKLSKSTFDKKIIVSLNKSITLEKLLCMGTP